MRINRFVLLRSLLPGLLMASVGIAALSGCKTDNAGGGTGTAGTTNGSGGGTGGGTIKIGHYASMTGSTATFGVDTDNGVRLAMEQINAGGGIDGKQIEVQTSDDASKPEEAKTVAVKFSEDPKIVAAIGEVSSGRSIAAAPVFERAGIPMVSPSSTNEEVTKKGAHIFRVCFIDPFQGYVMAKFTKDDLKFTKVAIFRDKKNEYSVGLADVFIKEFTKMGGTIVLDTAYQEGDSNFQAQLAQIKDAKPQAIFVPGYYSEVGSIARQAKELGLNVPLLGGDGWDSPDLVKGAGGAGGALEGSFFSNHYSKDDKAAKTQEFVKAFKAKYNTDPSGNAALGYDAMMIIADAIKRAKSSEREAITKALAETKDFPGVTGVITIDPERNARKSATVLEIKGAEFAYKATIDPPGTSGTKTEASPSAAPSASPAAAPK